MRGVRDLFVYFSILFSVYGRLNVTSFQYLPLEM
jgi:hypothetical protein